MRVATVICIQESAFWRLQQSTCATSVSEMTVAEILLQQSKLFRHRLFEFITDAVIVYSFFAFRL